MEPRKPPEYVLEVFADSQSVKEIVKAVLHTIFFHRYFPSIRPSLHEIPSLDIILPHIADPPEVETLIEAKASALVHQLQSMTANGGVRGQIAVRFFEKKRRRSGWFGGGMMGGRGGDEESCWEEWLLEVTIATPKTESGRDQQVLSQGGANHIVERSKVRRAMESSLQKTAMKIVNIVNRDRDHIPPITTSDQNPFPYQITLGQQETRGARFGGAWA
ncbi:MAG: hypothetical protein Q9227_002945 [Pyrenula ochraceoflavens]